MAPKRKPVASDDEPSSEFEPSGDSDSGSEFELEEEEEVKPKKAAPKKAAPKAKAAPAPKAAPAAKAKGGDGEAGSSAKKPAAKKPKKITEVTTQEDGWTLHPPNLIYKLNPKAQGGTKIAAFDFDGTLVMVKSGAQFPRTADDWKFFNKEVPNVLRQLHEDGYQLWIVSNQGGIKGALTGVMSEKVRARIDNVIQAVNKGGEVPVQVIASTQKGGDLHKPSKAMWDWLVQHANQGAAPDLGQCFYVGDAAGRPTDIDNGADSDRRFAQNVGIAFHLPEDKFGPAAIKVEGESGGSSGKNTGMAAAFRQLADQVAAEFHRARAFRTVADVIDAYPDVITSAKDLASIKGVGKSSLAKISEFLETGTLAALAEGGVTAGGEAPVDKAAQMAAKFL